MKTGIVRIGYAPITFGSNNTVTFGTPVYFADAEAGAREYSAEPKGDLHTVWANSALVYAGNANSGYDINVTLIDIIDDIAKSWYGDVTASMGNTAGIAEEGKAVSRPHFALILSEETTNGTGKTTVYYNCCAGKKPSLNGKTKEDGDNYNLRCNAWKRPFRLTVKILLSAVQQELSADTGINSTGNFFPIYPNFPK